MKRYVIPGLHLLGPAKADSLSQDNAYLSPIVDEIEAEMKEREDLDSMVVRRKKEEEAQKARA